MTWLANLEKTKIWKEPGTSLFTSSNYIKPHIINVHTTKYPNPHTNLTPKINIHRKTQNKNKDGEPSVTSSGSGGSFSVMRFLGETSSTTSFVDAGAYGAGFWCFGGGHVADNWDNSSNQIIIKVPPPLLSPMALWFMCLNDVRIIVCILYS